MPRGFKSLQRKLRRVKSSTPKRVHKENVESAKSINRAAQRRIAVQNAVASTELIRGFFIHIGSSEVHIGNDVPHAKYVEYGTGPQFGVSSYMVPPEIGPYKAADFSTELIRAIRQWIRLKPSISAHDPLAMAVSIARTIDEQGTSAQPFWRPALHTGIPKARRRAERGFKSDLRRKFN